MILRRVIEHVKAQHWTAVFLDFVIVVAGVFIGIQLGNWNEARHERNMEARVIARLHDEVAALVAARGEGRAFADYVGDGLDEAAQTLFSGDGDLSPDACRAIALSHIYAAQPDEIPVIEDLIATGRMDVIRNQPVRGALMDFIRARDQGRTTLEAVGRDIYKMSMEHPDLIEARLFAGEPPGDLRTRMRCDAAAMRRDRLFLNALVSNRAIHAEYSGQLFGAVDPALAALQAELESRRLRAGRREGAAP
ncbi:MAG: hypothetical protein R3C60_10245 [Parvularculaceae bacterium]